MLEGEILVDVSVKPRHISFGQVAKGEGAQREFEITVTEPEKVKVTGVTVDDEGFKLKKISEEDATSKWNIDFKGTDKIGRLATSVNIAIEGSEVPEVKLPIRANVVGDLQYTSNVYFSKRDDAFPERELVFSSRSGKSITLKGVEDPDGLLNLEITTKTGPKTTIKASVKDPEMELSRPTRHVFKVKTSDPDEPEVSIRYTISKRRAGRLPHMRGRDVKRGLGPLRDRKMFGKNRDKTKTEEKKGEGPK